MPDPISWAIEWPFLLAALVGGYLLGSIAFGLILTKATGAGDLRKIGSGNIGATNVLRTGRKGIAAATLLLDASKGAIAVLIAMRWGVDMGIAAGAGAMLGHIFPVWLKFKGGKGVSTYIGVLFGLYWPAALAFLAIWLVMALIFRISSLSALTATASSPVFLAYTGEIQLMETAILLGILVFYSHSDNIKRLLKGEESRIGGS